MSSQKPPTGSKKKIRFIDLFAGLGGTRIGLEKALQSAGLKGECVFASEIKPQAISAYQKNFGHEIIHGDIRLIHASSIPDFDILLAGFPCQSFSSAGKRKGFDDTRGTLFFDIVRILKEKKPDGFLLENVEGLVTHDRTDARKPMGRTFETILARLENLGYKVTWKVLDASLYGVPQRRRRVYILGSRENNIDLEGLPQRKTNLEDVLVSNIDEGKYIDTEFTKKLLSHYSLTYLTGKQITDKRGGSNNIHSWDFELKGKVTIAQKKLLEEMLKQRRRKSWAKGNDFPWSDGMPLTIEEIQTFYQGNNVQIRRMLDDLAAKGYLVKEKPKKSGIEHYAGYNIVAGRLSYEISHILDPKKTTPALVATDVTRLAVADNYGLRRLEVREGLRLFGFPEKYTLNGFISYKDAFDLLGNSVCVGVIELVASRLLSPVRLSAQL